MVAYSFKGRFVAPIRAGLGLPVHDEHRELGGYQPGQIIRPKNQTIRGEGRKRHARPGETIQHYHAQRSPKCFKIGEGRCYAVDDIRVFVRTDRIHLKEKHGGVSDFRKAYQLDRFAVLDGFADWSDMRAFWLEEHEGKQLGPFIGLLIKWEAMRWTEPLDPLEMLLDAARFIEVRKPEWAKSARAAVATARAALDAQRLARIRAIIEAVDNRCLHADGPVTQTLQEMEQREISAVYALACGKPESWRPK